MERTTEDYIRAVKRPHPKPRTSGLKTGRVVFVEGLFVYRFFRLRVCMRACVARVKKVCVCVCVCVCACVCVFKLTYNQEEMSDEVSRCIQKIK